ncbi:MAG: homoserine kinase, partial [Acidimicrobiia bacterium]|nr:homoserine kinase [Acidimicrobiia bacterium]
MSSASAPGSSANLGPGYDVLALALDLRCRVTVSASEEWSILSGGAPADHLGVSMVKRTAAMAAPGAGPLTVSIESEIPLARGLGSSAALIAATAGAARGLVGGSTDPLDLLPIAAEIEGHPDNVAAALLGGLIAVGPGGEVRSLEIHPSLQMLVAVPDATLRTDEARKATAAPVSTSVASRTAARLAMLVEGLRMADPAALAAAAGDELHEERRASLSPITGRMIGAARRAGALHACWSGAGPSVLAVVTRATADSVRSALSDAG